MRRLLWSVALALPLQVTSMSGQTLPVAPGAEVAQAKCVSCHGADLIVSQRLTAPAWDREVAKMERWGVQFADGERAALLPYLASQFSARPAARRADSILGAGASAYQAACRSCHDDDLAAQQRLSEAAWGRTVDKMVRWGAVVRADHRAPLLSYLAAMWGTR